MSVLVSVRRKTNSGRMPTLVEGSTSTYILYSAYPYNFFPRESHQVATDLKIIIPPGYIGILSQPETRNRFWPLKVMGSPLIRSNETKHVEIDIHNLANKFWKMAKGAAVAQLTIVPCFTG